MKLAGQVAAAIEQLTAFLRDASTDANAPRVGDFELPVQFMQALGQCLGLFQAGNRNAGDGVHVDGAIDVGPRHHDAAVEGEAGSIDARRFVEQGGAYINNRRFTDPAHVPSDADFLNGRWLLLRRGKRQLAVVERRV